MRCDCAEARLDVMGISNRIIKSRRLIGVDRHDCLYIRQRNALIPDAKAEATRKVPVLIGATEKAAWSLEFISAMNRLAREKGLVP